MGSGVRRRRSRARTFRGRGLDWALRAEPGSFLGSLPTAAAMPHAPEGVEPGLRPRPRQLDEGQLLNLTLRLGGPQATPPGLRLPIRQEAPHLHTPTLGPGPAPDAEVTRKGSYTDVLGQGDHPLVTFDPRRGLEQRAGGGLALGQRPQVWEVRGLPAQLPGACGQSRAGQGRGRGWGPSGRLGLPVCGVGPRGAHLAACAAGPPPGGSCPAPRGAWGAPCRGSGWGSSRG